MNIRIFKLNGNNKIADFNYATFSTPDYSSNASLLKGAKKTAKENAPKECAGYYVEIFDEVNQMPFGNFTVKY